METCDFQKNEKSLIKESILLIRRKIKGKDLIRFAKEEAESFIFILEEAIFILAAEEIHSMTNFNFNIMISLIAV